METNEQYKTEQYVGEAFIPPPAQASASTGMMMSTVPAVAQQQQATSTTVNPEAWAAVAGRGPMGIRLKPCEVCGDKSTGYHFGVISCEACKSFYRRSLKRGGEYFCEKGGNCSPAARGNNSCPACRLKRCRMVGMSPLAVKKGRYSHEKRAETIIQSRLYWENLQQIQEAGGVPDYQAYLQAHSLTSDTPLPPIKDVWPVEPRPKKPRKMHPQVDHRAATTSVPASSTALMYDSYNAPAPYTTQGVYNNNSTQPVATYYMDGRPVNVSYNQTEHDDIQETHITEMELQSPDYIDYSRLGPSVKELVVDGQALFGGLNTVLAQMRSNIQTQTEDGSGNNNSEKSSASDVCQLQIDGLPLSELFQSFLPHLQNGGGQKMLEQYQQLSAQLSREKCVSFLQTMQQQHQQLQQQQSLAQSTSQVAPAGAQNKSAEKAREEASLVDLHETAETLINFAKYPVEKKAVVVEMIPQASGVNPPPDQNYVGQQGPSSTAVSTGYSTATSVEEPFPVEHFEFTKEDNELMQECSATMDSSEAELIEKLIADTFEHVEKTKFISDEVAAAIPDIQRKFLDQRSQREKMYGHMGPVTSAEHLQIYRQSGLDGEGRAAGDTLNREDNLMERVVLMFVKLYRSFPGYNNLPIEDQASVLKGTKVDVGYMMNTKLVNVKEKLLTSQFLDITYDMNYFKSFAPEETVLQTFQVADRVQSLDLNNLETAIAAAFVAMQPDVCKTDEGKQLCYAQRSKNLKALYLVLCKERSEDDAMDIIREILGLLKQLRVQEDMLSHYWDKFFQDYEYVNVPKCLSDIQKQ